MFSKSSVKPLELVVSAIHCLGEKNGSSPQNILRFLIGKYNLDTNTLRPHVQTGLKRGVNFGMLTQQAGLYRLNNILRNPGFLKLANIRKSQRTNKRSKTVRKRKLRQTVGKKGKLKVAKSAPSGLQKNKRKVKKSKNKRKKIRGASRRVQNETRKKKQKQLKTKGKKLKLKVEKEKKVSNGTEQTEQDGGECVKSENAKDGEAAKTTVKT